MLHSDRIEAVYQRQFKALEKRWRVPLSEEFKDKVRESFSTDACLFSEGRSSEFEEDLAEHLRELETYLKALPVVFSPTLQGIQASSPARCRRAPSRRYQGKIEKYARLIDLVVRQQVEKAVRDRRRNPTPPIARRYRIDWESIAQEWNERYPYDSMTKGVLAHTYYQVRVSEDVRREYFARTASGGVMHFLESAVRLVPSLGYAFVQFIKTMTPLFEAAGRWAIDNREILEQLAKGETLARLERLDELAPASLLHKPLGEVTEEELAMIHRAIQGSDGEKGES